MILSVKLCFPTSARVLQGQAKKESLRDCAGMIRSKHKVCNYQVLVCNPLPLNIKPPSPPDIEDVRYIIVYHTGVYFILGCVGRFNIMGRG